MKFSSVLSLLVIRSIYGVEQKSDEIGNLRSRNLRNSSGNSLSAAINKDPTYAGAFTPIGAITMHFNTDDSFLLTMDMNGLDPACEAVNCGVRIVGGSCSGPPYTSDMTYNTTTAFYNAQPYGTARSAFVFNNGENYASNLGKFVVFEDATQTVIGCGELKKNRMNRVLKGKFGKYPELVDDTVEPEGTVYVSFEEDDSFILTYDIKGMEQNCENCGLHIHEGLSCDTAAEVLGHGWNTVQTQDLWFAQFGAVYNSNKLGRAKGSFRLYNGFGYLNNMHHAVVLHGKGGRRVGCGVLERGTWRGS